MLFDNLITVPTHKNSSKTLQKLQALVHETWPEIHKERIRQSLNPIKKVISSVYFDL